MEGNLVDEETGEILAKLEGPGNNAETGEPEAPSMTEFGARRRVPFQIPREFKDGLAGMEGSSRTRRPSDADMEPVPVGTSFGQINPVLLFLPAIVYSCWFLVLLTIFEVVCHVWAHHKNKILKDANVYFRSPFHSISSEFCALCQSENCMNRVEKLQEIRMHKFLRQCYYMKRAVT
ncbi:uncharacterized protein LOC105699213 [Orussus abietinus]|uniref:uncharacterized protein LOC105699213 n=1 Tax=Orussus abietinus TaxID=222816 RepID=UPI0006269B8F|nr:uncharacterized protein LOC105699213 [Orussus abietinus]